MSAANPMFVPEGGRDWRGHAVEFATVPVKNRPAMTEVWDALMWLKGREEVILDDRLTDRRLAQYLGRSTRFVQKGLKLLQDAGLIRRHRSIGRRRIEITGFLKGRKEEPGASAPKPPFKPAATKAKGPAAIPAKPTTPEQLAGAKAAAAKAAEPPPPVEPDFEGMTPGEIWAATRPKEIQGKAKLPRTMPKKE